jgi:uncharacterized protein YdaU (DUF1376 family)
MPVFTDALIGDTTHLSAEEFGAYCLILFATWRNNGEPFPDEDARLARICRVGAKKWQRLRPVLAGFFDLSSSFWRQKRLEKEWHYVQLSVAQKSRAGTASALKRRNSAPTAVVEPLVRDGQQNLNNPHPIPIIEESKEDASHPTRARDPVAGFVEWWLEYPHKVGEPVALKSYRRALARASPADLLDGLRRYIANKPPDRNWLNPATFLNQDRWKDQPAPVIPQIASSNGKSRHTPAEKLFAGFAAAAGFDCGVDRAADEPLLDRG